MMVLLKWPAWKGFAMFGELNSTMTFLRPAEGSEGSLRPKLGLKPYVAPALRIWGRTIDVRASGLKKKPTNVPLTMGFLTRGDSGNCTIPVRTRFHPIHIGACRLAAATYLLPNLLCQFFHVLALLPQRRYRQLQISILRLRCPS